MALLGLAFSPLATAQTTVTLGPYTFDTGTGDAALPRNYTARVGTTYNFSIRELDDAFAQLNVATVELAGECAGVMANTFADLGVSNTATTNNALGFAWTPTVADEGMSYTLCFNNGAQRDGVLIFDAITFHVPHAAPVAGTSPDNLLLTVGDTETVLTATAFSYMGDDLMYSAEVTASDPTGVVAVTPTGSNATGEFVVRAQSVGEASIRITARDSLGRTAAQTIMVTVNAAPAPPAESSSSSGGIVALAVIAAGGYYWWKKRQIASGNAAKMAVLPDVSFDLDRSDERAFYTRMNWQNAGNSNWQIRSNLALHTKYSGELLDWNADSHLGYRLKGKFGEFNPYLRGKFVQNGPENAEMRKIYSFGLNYSVPNRFAIQIVQPDSDLENYSLGIQWRRKSKIRYGLHGETGSKTYRFSGQFWF